MDTFTQAKGWTPSPGLSGGHFYLSSEEDTFTIFNLEDKTYEGLRHQYLLISALNSSTRLTLLELAFELIEIEPVRIEI